MISSKKSLNPLSLAIGGLISLAVGVGIGRFVYTPILPLMLEALGLTEGQAGLIASANFGGYLVGAFLAATPVLIGSRRMWLLGSLMVGAFTTGAMAFTDSITIFILLRFIGGVASAFIFVFSSALVLDRLSSANQKKLLPVHFAGVGVGIAVSAILVSALVALKFDWKALWIASGLISIIALFIVAILVPDQSEQPIQPSLTGQRANRALIIFVIAYGLFGFGYVITGTFLVTIVRAVEEVRSLEFTVWLVVGCTAAPSVGLWTWISARIGIARSFALACVIEAIGVASSVLWVGTAGVLLAAALLGGTMMGITALGLIAARNLSKGDPRRAVAMITASFGLGQIIGPTFAGIVYDTMGSFLIPTLTAVSALLLSALLVSLISSQAT